MFMPYMFIVMPIFLYTSPYIVNYIKFTIKRAKFCSGGTSFLKAPPIVFPFPMAYILYFLYSYDIYIYTATISRLNKFLLSFYKIDN